MANTNATTAINPKLVKDFSRKHRLEPPTAEKVLWLSRALYAISKSPISRDFALIGGSAIVFLYRDLYRFSTDLDLDFIGNVNLGKKGTDEIKKRIKADQIVLRKIARDLGMKFSLRGTPVDRFVQYGLEYRSEYTRTGIVELDMSYRYCHSALGPVSRAWPLVLESIVPSFKVQTLKPEELYASKVTAMLEGKEGKRLDFPHHIGLMFKRKVRHLFDVCLFAQDVESGRFQVDLQLLHNLVVLFGLTRIVNFRYFRGNAIGSYTEDDVRDELRSVVPRGVPIPKVDEMKWEVRKFFDRHLFNWSDPEHRFVEDFLAGNFRPEDLFGGTAIAKGLHAMHYYKEILGKMQTL